MIQVKIFYGQNDLRNFSYLIWDSVSAAAWVIDPFDEIPIIDYIKKDALVLRGILNTHQHWDHIRGNSALKDQFNCSVFSRDQKLLDLGHGQVIHFLDTPGHTMDHLAFLWEENHQVKGLFSGDTLFNSGVGNCRDRGDVDALYETTSKLKTLDDKVILYPGHDYVLKNLLFAKSCEPENQSIDEALKLVKQSDSEKGLRWTLGQEKKVNPFFRLNSEEIRQRLISAEMSLDAGPAIEGQLFKTLRSLRDKW